MQTIGRSRDDLESSAGEGEGQGEAGATAVANGQGEGKSQDQDPLPAEMRSVQTYHSQETAMGLGIDQEQMQRRDDICHQLEDQEDTIAEALSEYEESIKAARKRLEDQVALYNQRLKELRKWVAYNAAKAELYILAQSEEWLQTEEGQRASTWQEFMRDVGIRLNREVELHLPDPAEPQIDLVEWEQIFYFPNSADEIHL